MCMCTCICTYIYLHINVQAYVYICMQSREKCQLFKFLHHSETPCTSLQHTGRYCNTLQHTTTHDDTLQHTVTVSWRVAVGQVTARNEHHQNGVFGRHGAKGCWPRTCVRVSAPPSRNWSQNVSHLCVTHSRCVMEISRTLKKSCKHHELYMSHRNTTNSQWAPPWHKLQKLSCMPLKHSRRVIKISRTLDIETPRFRKSLVAVWVKQITKHELSLYHIL